MQQAVVHNLFPTKINVGEQVFLSNIRAAMQRDIPWLQPREPNKLDAVLVAGGPSLADFEDELKERYEQGHIFFAMNNTAKWLEERGIIPHYHVLLDARASVSRFVLGNNKTHYLIASQCCPEVFDAAGKVVTLWHPHVEGIQELIGDKPTALIGGGTTVGIQTMAIAYALGFRGIGLYGYDSSYRGTEGHAYPQPENDADNVISVRFAGRTFLCATWMLHQVEEFKSACTQLMEKGCSLGVFGDGFLQETFTDLVTPPWTACYDLNSAPASWDFSTWLATAEMYRRASGVSEPLQVAFKAGTANGFRADNLPDPGKQQMLDNVMRPLLKLYGAVESTEYVGRRYPYVAVGLCSGVREYGLQVPHFQIPPDYARAVAAYVGDTRPIVLNLREAEHWPARNSNVEAWIKFGRMLRNQGEAVVVVRDTAKAHEDLFPLPTCKRASEDVLFRAALFAKAKIVMGVSNGPLMLAHLSETPYVVFNQLVENYPAGTPEWWEFNIGVKVGEGYPWATPAQKLAWKNDSYENILAAYSEMKPLLENL